jgi:hypothetical protein
MSDVLRLSMSVSGSASVIAGITSLERLNDELSDTSASLLDSHSSLVLLSIDSSELDLSLGVIDVAGQSELLTDRNGSATGQRAHRHEGLRLSAVRSLLGLLRVLIFAVVLLLIMLLLLSVS